MRKRSISGSPQPDFDEKGAARCRQRQKLPLVAHVPGRRRPFFERPAGRVRERKRHGGPAPALREGPGDGCRVSCGRRGPGGAGRETHPAGEAPQTPPAGVRGGEERRRARDFGGWGAHADAAESPMATTSMAGPAASGRMRTRTDWRRIAESGPTRSTFRPAFRRAGPRTRRCGRGSAGRRRGGAAAARRSRRAPGRVFRPQAPPASGHEAFEGRVGPRGRREEFRDAVERSGVGEGGRGG